MFAHLIAYEPLIGCTNALRTRHFLQHREESVVVAAIVSPRTVLVSHHWASIWRVNVSL